MGFRNDAYATVWDAKQGKGRYNDLKIQISKKNKESGQYETEFSGWVRFVGKAADLGLLDEKTRIKILSCDVTNHYDKEKNQMYWNPVVFDAEVVTNNNSSPYVAPINDDFMKITDGLEEELPFV